jgi:hypothetical protein
VRGVREDGHVQAGLGDDRPRHLEADAGDLRQPLRGRQHGRAGPGARAGHAVGRDTVRGRDLVQAGGDLAVQVLDVLGEQADDVQVRPGHGGVAGTEHHPGQCLLQLGRLRLQPGLRERGQRPRVTFPGDHRPHDGFR